MRGTLASSERTVDVKTAIDEVQRVLRDAGKLNYRTPSGEFPHQSAASLIGKNGVIVASRGKGLGRQCEASALFELYEHAVSMGVVERIDSNAEISTAQLYKGGALEPDFLGRNIRNSGVRTTLATPFYQVSKPAGAGVVWLPAAVYDEVPEAGDDPHLALAARYWSSNGYAAGMTVADASLHALNEVLERDAFSGFLLDVCCNRRVGAELALAESDLGRLPRSIERASDSSVTVRVLPSLAATVCIAFSNRHDYHRRRVVGLGCSGIPAYAAERALLEYEQEIAVEHEFEAGLLDTSDDDLDPETSSEVVHHEFLRRAYFLSEVPPAAQAKVELSQLPSSSGDFRETASRVIAAGYPVLRRTLHRRPQAGGSEVGPTVVQIVVIGAEKFHLVRLGLPVEPIGRMRKPEIVAACQSGSGSLPVHYQKEKHHAGNHT